MAGKIYRLYFAEGIETAAPIQSLIETAKIAGYVDDAEFLSAKGSAATEGDCYYNTTSDTFKIYNGTTWDFIVDRAELEAHTSDGTIHFTKASISHTEILDIGTNSHSAIDSHISTSNIHFTESSIVHQNISGAGTNTHGDIDTHIGTSSIHFTESSIVHQNISGAGTNTHGDIDTHIADGTKHFTEGSIDHANISGIGTNSHSTIDTHLANTTIHMPGAIGTNGQVMTVTGGAPSWETPATAAGAPVGTITPWIGGYFTNNANASFTNVLGNTIANVNTLLNSTGWYVCDGAALNDASSPIFNAAGRHLPNLTDERFLQGNTTAGGIGGSNTMLDHTHTHSLTVAAHTHTFTTGNQSAGHTHSGSTGTESAGHTHSMLVDSGYGGTSNYWTMSNENRQGTKQTGGTSNTHTHSFTTGGVSANHTHSGTTAGASANSISGSVGTGSAATSTNVRPKYLNVLYIMKVK